MTMLRSAMAAIHPRLAVVLHDLTMVALAWVIANVVRYSLLAEPPQVGRLDAVAARDVASVVEHDSLVHVEQGFLVDVELEKRPVHNRANLIRSWQNSHRTQPPCCLHPAIRAGLHLGCVSVTCGVFLQKTKFFGPPPECPAPCRRLPPLMSCPRYQDRLAVYRA